MTEHEIIRDIDNHLSKSNKNSYSSFYIGITNDIERRLFGEHNVPREGHRRIHRKADSEETARAVETHFLNKGMKGGGGGGTGDGSAKFVYCYEISSSTRE